MMTPWTMARGGKGDAARGYLPRASAQRPLGWCRGHACGAVRTRGRVDEDAAREADEGTDGRVAVTVRSSEHAVMDGS